MRALLLLIVGIVSVSHGSAMAAIVVLDGGFESQAIAQSLPYYQTGPSGQLWGRNWTGGWNPEGLASSWRSVDPGKGAWVGGAICRSEDFATGWKWAHTGDVFGVIKDRQTMSQTFVADADATGILSWYDTNRNSWREHTWYGRPNDYSVTVTDNLGIVQVIGSYTSQVYGGLESNSWTNRGDDRSLLANKQGWVARTGNSFNLVGGRTYTLSFNSLSPYIYDSNGNITGVDDRTTLLDDISLMGFAPTVPEPSTIAIFGLGSLGFAYLRRQRQR
jgi:hypothetical protein